MIIFLIYIWESRLKTLKRVKTNKQCNSTTVKICGPNIWSSCVKLILRRGPHAVHFDVK